MSKNFLSRRALLVYAGIALVLAVFVVAAFIYRGRGKAVRSTFDIQPYISAYTAGVISKTSSIQVVFTKDLAPDGAIGQAADKGLLKLSPKVKGDLLWANARTLEFVPKEALESDKMYEVHVALEDLFENLPKEAREFVYTFQTIRQQASCSDAYIHLEANGSKVTATVRALLLFSDVVSLEEVQKGLSLKQGGEKVAVNIENGSDDREFRLISEPLTSEEDCEITFEGKHIGISKTMTETVTFHASSPFTAYGYDTKEADAQYVRIYFSQPLDVNQDFRGLVYGENLKDVRVKVDGNVMDVYFGNRLEGTYNLQLAGGIRSYGGQRMDKDMECELEFTGNKPALQFLQTGTILPATGQVQIPFKAVSLKGVDVEVYQIFESNMGQYFQTNSLTDGYVSELRRVGRRIFRKTLMLEGLATTRADNVYALDLSQVIQLEPGAMYRISLSMRRCLSTYTCDEELELVPLESIPTNDENGYYDDDYYYDVDYDWEERNNPCNDYYYSYRGKQWTNILVSNIGLIAKRNGNGSLRAFATGISEGKPLSGVEMKLLDYQLQTLGEGTSNSDGMVEFEAVEGRDPFLIIAQQGQQRSYLPVQQNNSLSYSTFDVGGNQLKRGVQGFIYGERDVWRPGDTMHLTLIIEDKLNSLPESHPVEFALSNSRGQLVERKVVPGNAYNMYSFSTATTPDAPTGTYNLVATVGKARFSKSIRVETIKPNRLKVNLTFNNELLHADAYNYYQIESHWLHGAPARGLMTDISVRLFAAETSFKGFEDYIFTDVSKEFYSYEFSGEEARLDENGELSSKLYIRPITGASGMINAVFRTRVLEDGGGYSMGVTTKKISPFTSYVGLLEPKSERYYIETDTDQSFKVVSVDEDGRPQSNQHLKYAVYKLAWSWWWEHSDSDLASYENSKSAKLITDGDIYTDGRGMGSFIARVNYPEWGRYLVRVVDLSSGHVASDVVYWDWPASRERTADRAMTGSTVLALTADKTKYNAGETAEISVPTPLGGTLLVSVENGAAVLKSEWVDAKDGETIVKLPITGEMAPNVYVDITLLQPYGQTANDLPLRMYGAIPLMVENPKSHLEPILDTPDEVRPEGKVEVSVKEKSGRPMTFTLAVVDEGLLDLTNFKTPDPWNFFFARQALGVNTMDLFDNVIGAYAGRIAGVLSVGGGMMEDAFLGKSKEEAEKNPLANRFTPVVRCFGPYHLEKGAQKISFQMPNYVGSVRIMAVASGEGAYGSAEKTMAVRNALMVQATLPRMLAPDEEMVLPATVFAMKNNVKSVAVKLETNDLLQITGNAQEALNFNGTGDQVVNFRVRTTQRTGIATAKVIAEGNGERSEYEIALEVRNPNPEIRRSIVKRVDAGKTVTVASSEFGSGEVNSARVEVSSLPAIGLRDKLEFMMSYPHACLEQQTSRAFVQMLYPEVAPVTPAEKDTLSKQVKAFIARVAQFQLPNGGFSLWPNMSTPSYWGTSYVGHFLLEAKQRGYSVSPNLINNWKRFQQNEANNWSPKRSYDNSDLTQAYRLYTLALAGSAQMGIMNRLRDVKELSTAARWRLATAYELAGAKSAAEKLISSLSTTVEEDDDVLNFGSMTRDKAMLLESLTRLKKMEQAMQTLQTLAEAMSGSKWLSTQEIGYGMLAIAQFAKEAKVAKDGVKGELSCKNDKTTFATELPTASKVYNFGGNTAAPEVKFQNTGKGALFVTATVVGIPNSSQVERSANNLECETSYMTLSGSPLDPATITQGKEFVARVTVRNPGVRGDLSQLALTYAVPSGWELRNARLEGESNFESSSSTYQDYRDDRVFTYFDLSAGYSKTFYFVVNASYRGTFQLPPTSCQAMYNADVNATTAGGRVQVVK